MIADNHGHQRRSAGVIPLGPQGHQTVAFTLILTSCNDGAMLLVHVFGKDLIPFNLALFSIKLRLGKIKHPTSHSGQWPHTPKKIIGPTTSAEVYPVFPEKGFWVAWILSTLVPTSDVWLALIDTPLMVTNLICAMKAEVLLVAKMLWHFPGAIVRLPSYELLY